MKLELLKVKVVLSGFLALLAFVYVSGCQKQASPEASPPTNADIAMALIAHENSGNCNIIPMTLAVTERGKRGEDGSWPLSVRYTCIDKSSTGMEKFEKQTSIKMFKSQGSSGNPEWVIR